MSLHEPKPVSLSTSPSLGPAAARAATQDAQIVQLVQQVRTLEHTISQLRAQLEAEKARGAAAAQQIRERWQAESREWRDGCDILQSKHRLAHLGTRVALEHERTLRLEDREVLVREQIARLLREHKITLFQTREMDLLSQMAALEDELEIYREELAEVRAQHEAEVAHLTAKLAKSDALREEKAEQLGDFTEVKKALETELAALRALGGPNAKQIERLTLQVETLRVQNAIIEENNKELQHQVDKWQNLESKGEKEIADLRKRRIDLEVRVKELESTLKETQGLDKKIAILEASLLETQEQVERGNQNIVEARNEASQARKEATIFERQARKLEAALEARKTQSAESLKEIKEKVRSQQKPSSSTGRLQIPSAVQEIFEHSGDETTEAPTKPSLHRQKPASTGSEKAKAKEGPVQHDRSEAGDGRRKRKNKGKEKLDDLDQGKSEEGELPEVESSMEVQEARPSVEEHHRPLDRNRDCDNEQVLLQTKKRLTLRSPGSRSVDVLVVATKPRSKPGKAKASGAERQDEQVTLPKKRARSKSRSRSDDTGSKKPITSRLDATEGEHVDMQKKKKRKLNLTGGGIFPGPAGFTWDQNDGEDLGIPSVLSPVKEGQPVPARSGTSSLLSSWRIWK